MRRSAFFISVALAAMVPSARAQPGELPEGHPPTDGPAKASANQTAKMPAGHPRPGKNPPKNRVDLASDLSVGTVEVHVKDGSGRPVGNKPVTLGIVRQSVEEGESRQQQTKKTDARGVAVFEGLPGETNFSFRATVEHGAATYASEPFRPSKKGGHRVLVHVFPVTRDINQALVGMRGLVYLQPREDVFQFEAQFQVFNIGGTAWVPDSVTFRLPPGAKGFQAQETMDDARLVENGSLVSLLGTFPPGRRQVSYRFQLDNDRSEQRTFELPLPPHVAELQVIVEGSRDMNLSVSGFPEARSARGENGGWLHVVGARLSPGETPLDSVRFTVDGLPVPDRGRWYALGLAILAVLVGLGDALNRGRKTDQRIVEEDGMRARELLLGELVTLEKLRQQGEVGPRTYDSARTALLDAVTRLDAQLR